jgi:TonB family protein
LQLAAALAAHIRALAESEPSDQLLANCRRDLGKALGAEAAARQNARRGWWNARSWVALFRVSPDFHPAWSVAALLLVGILAGLAGYQGVGRAPLPQPGQPLMTISAVPPVFAQEPATSGIRAQRSEPRENAAPPAASQARNGRSVVSQGSPAGVQAPLSLRPRGPIPQTQRDAPSPEIPDGLFPAAAWDIPAGSRLDGWSRRMESLWWGGVRVDPAEQRSRLVQSPPPEYPEAARRARIEGPVTLGVRIGGDGSVEDVTLLSGEPVLGRAAMRAVEQWRYVPPRIGGRPVSILSSVTLVFELR